MRRLLVAVCVCLVLLLGIVPLAESFLSSSGGINFFDEFELFHGGAHDDIVDAASGAFSKLTDHIPLCGGGAPSIFGN